MSKIRNTGELTTLFCSVIQKGMMVMNNKEVKCFFCSKKLTREEIAILEVRYFPVCPKCRKWLSKLKEEKFFRLLAVFLTLFFLCLITIVIN
jgi:hypothetical protein